MEAPVVDGTDGITVTHLEILEDLVIIRGY